MFVDFESSDVKKRKCLYYAYFNYAFIQFFAFFCSGSSTQIRHLALRSLLPATDHYMTYEGKNEPTFDDLRNFYVSIMCA